MKRYLPLLCITLGYVGLSLPLLAQPMPKATNNTSKLSSPEHRQDLAIQYTDAAKFKAASQNTNYRYGDLVSVDVAVLNTSAFEVHSLRLDLFVDIAVADSAGKRVPIMLYGSPDFILQPKHYERLKPGEVKFAHILLRVGCDSERIPRFGSGRELFETNSFVNMGRGCIEFQKAGDYSIHALIRNSRVVVVDKDKTIKTLTGNSESTPLNITLAL